MVKHPLQRSGKCCLWQIFEYTQDGATLLPKDKGQLPSIPLNAGEKMCQPALMNRISPAPAAGSFGSKQAGNLHPESAG
jgi:hypothetical protein